ncbi:DUF7282 domain-containing protein [Allohahella marinimesophila]|uniref:DUF7282 domain-containing protein n=1 Tax=Allohahella marinimesophila TaxID=1054972 RepID=A0ABP7NG86_9GAMM
MKNVCMRFALATSLAAAGGIASADDMGRSMAVSGSDQDMSGGTVTADSVTAAQNGWLVVHRTDKGMKPGPVVAYAPLKKGENSDVSAILTESVKSGEMLMLMLHAEEGGTKTGVFEYTLGAKEDGPVKVDGKLVMAVVAAK